MRGRPRPPSACSRSRTCRPSSTRARASSRPSTACRSRSSAGETLAIVGESGCGKSVTALSLMRLISDPPGRIVGGAIRLDGVDLMGLDEATMRTIRGNQISMVFQEPMTSLNPVMTIGRQIGEALILHQNMSQQGRAEPRHRDAAPGRHPRARAARQGIPAPAVGRHAPARHDRHGARLQSQGADRRRADHRARRHHPGADPRPHRASCSASSAPPSS